jgi:hypothetical protein
MTRAALARGRPATNGHGPLDLQHHRRRGSWSTPGRTGRLAAVFVAIAGLTAACVGGPAATPSLPGGSATPSSSTVPSASPSMGGPISHATGAQDLLLRVDEIGGFVAPGVIITRTPAFSLYGDGTVIYRNLDAPAGSPVAAPRGVTVIAPLSRARLSEPEVQDLLALALDEGGLRDAPSGTYDPPGIADAPTTVFELHAGGLDRRLLVYALGISPGGPEASPADALLRAKLTRLADLLTRYRPPADAPTETYQPARFRVALVMPSDALTPERWPWPDLAPAAFTAGGCNETSWPCRVMDRSRVASLGVVPVDGGFDGFVVLGPDGRRYGMAVRPLLPDEAA